MLRNSLILLRGRFRITLLAIWLGPVQVFSLDLPQQPMGMDLTGYPGCVAMSEATERLNKDKPSTWLNADSCHSDDSIKDVIEHFKPQEKRLKGAMVKTRMLTSLMHNNWQTERGTLAWPPDIFFVGDRLKASKPNVRIDTTLGVIPLGDSIVRVHLMSPHPSSANNNELVAGTMIILIKERMPDGTIVADENEKGYTGREVTRGVWVKFKPEPEHPGGRGRPVVLKAVFSSKGAVTRIVVVGNETDQFTQAAINAARKIKFEPAIKDGRYVSLWVQLEYNFHP